MTLAEQLSAPPPPPEWAGRAESKWDGEKGEITTGFVEPVEDFNELLEQFDYDPERVRIVGTVNQWRKQLPNGEWIVSYFFKVQSKSADLDLPALYAAAKSRKPVKSKAKPVADRATVVALADVQAGKVGSLGGTPELVERLEATRKRLTQHLRKRKPSRLVLAEVGDLFEGFESGGNPMFTNDLSLAQQMDLAAAEVFEFVKLMQTFGPVDVVPVPSNHTAWRNGKQNLGRPSDDLGLHVHRQVERLAHASGFDATWHYPREYDESVSVDVLGTRLGVVHGNQFAPGRAPEWWAKQQHGGQAVGAADVLLTGHYHHFAARPTGRNPYNKRAKWWLQAPTLDNGSDWFRNIQGEDSEPGLLVFDIDRNGFNLQSLTVL